ncbi:hypothetical protein NFJ02_44g112040 [Pycnococcus provasolii]
MAAPGGADQPELAWHCPGAAGVDAFAQNDWRQHRNWCNPPWQLLDKLARHLDHTGAAATVVTPAWDDTAWAVLAGPRSTSIADSSATLGRQRFSRASAGSVSGMRRGHRAAPGRVSRDALPSHRGNWHRAFNSRRTLPQRIKYDLRPPLRVAPWADAIHAAWEPELAGRDTSDLLLMAISASRAPKTYESYQTGINHLFEYCAELELDPLQITPAD